MSNLSYILATGFLVFYSLKLWLYTSAYKDELHFARHNLYDFPDFYHVYSWLGLIYKDMGRRYEAVGCWADALELRPLDFKTLFNTAHVLGELGHLQAAYDILEKAKKCLIPDMVEEEMLKMISNRQKHIKNAIEKSQIQAQNQIIDMAKEIKKGKKVI